MSYVIQSGKYESGTLEQQSGFRQLFGNNVLSRFDLYFHWYNLIHELGHCFVGQSQMQLSDIQQEMFVNEFAVGYYRYVGEIRRLKELQTMVEGVMDQLPSPVPAEESFIAYYERIWNTDAIVQTTIYGYFQFNSVLAALKKQRSFEDAAMELGQRIHPSEVITCHAELCSSNAGKYLDTALANMKAFGMDVPSVRLQLMDDPTIQCVRWE